MNREIAVPLIIIAGAILLILFVLQQRAQKKEAELREYNAQADAFRERMYKTVRENSEAELRRIDREHRYAAQMSDIVQRRINAQNKLADALELQAKCQDDPQKAAELMQRAQNARNGVD